MSTLPPLPTSVVGSHGKPGWWFTLVRAWEAGDAGPGDLDEMFDDAADTAIRDMERAGIDVITDGEVRRLDGYVDSYYAIIKGIQPLPVRRKVGPWGYDQQTRYEAVGRIDGARTCGCQDALATAIITRPELVPEQTKRDLEPIIGRYMK